MSQSCFAIKGVDGVPYQFNSKLDGIAYCSVAIMEAEICF